MICAIVVLYCPVDRLIFRLLSSLIDQVDLVVLIDNTPGVVNVDRFLIYRNVKYIPLGDNLGIAKAQNVGIEFAIAHGCEWILLLDQDSELSTGMVKNLQKTTCYLEDLGKKVAAVGPLFCDEKTGLYSEAIRHRGPLVRRLPLTPVMTEPVNSDYIISSGSLIRVSVLQKIGVMMEKLFIDWVDIEWGLRARNQGYHCYIAPSAVMVHCIGDDSVKFAGRNRNLHSHFRNYYIVRNATYLLRMKYMGWQWRSAVFLKIPQYILFYSYYSDNKVRNFFSLIGAVFDGFFSRLGRKHL